MPVGHLLVLPPLLDDKFPLVQTATSNGFLNIYSALIYSSGRCNFLTVLVSFKRDKTSRGQLICGILIITDFPLAKLI